MVHKDKVLIRSVLAIGISLMFLLSAHAAETTAENGDYDYGVMENLIQKNAPAYAYSYYVSAGNGSDENDGSKEAPFASISYALSQAKGGEIIFVAEGDYGDLKFGATYSKKSDKSTPIAEVFTDWVTLKAMDGHTPTLDSLTLGTNHDEGGWYSIDFDQKGNSDLRLRIDGFRIKNNVKIKGSRYVDIRNCRISQAGDFASMTLAEKGKYMGNAGVHIFNGQHIYVLYNEIFDTGVGVWAMTRDLVLKGNHIHHLTHDGIQLHGGENMLVENNIVHDLDDGMSDAMAAADKAVKKVNMHVDGMQIYIINAGSTAYARRLDNVTIRGNLFYHAEAMDVMISNPASWIADLGGGFGAFTFENNIFAPSNGSMFIMAAKFDSLIFRHNTVLYTPNDQWTSVWGREFGQDFTNPNSTDYYMQTWWYKAVLPKLSDYYVYNNVMMNVGQEPWVSGGDNINAHRNIFFIPGAQDETLDDNAGYVTGTSPYVEIDGKLQDYLDAGMIPGAPVQGAGLVQDNGIVEENIESFPTDFIGTDRGQQPDIGAVELF